ncbi:MAG TPA: glycoside hydrolase, partial [Ktedonobacteraceae bacterium]|nr:glycoside hydrolase [Ktedonobacteraceae bacterium]
MMRQHRLRHLFFKVGIPALLGIMVLSGAFTVGFSRQAAYAASAVTINGGTTFQTIDGFGMSEAFGQANGIKNLASGPQRQILDLLFSPTTGAGFTILRNLLPSDSGNTIEPTSPGSPNATPAYTWDGSSEGQIWLSQQAKSYGVTRLYGDAWSAPGYMKTNGTENNGGALCGTPSASCGSGDWRQAYANYLTQYARDYASAGVPLTDIGAFNEPDFTASYSSMVMNPTQTADMVRFLKPTLSSAGLNPQVVCCDPTGWPQARNYTSAIVNNTSINATVDIFSSHGYSGAPNSLLTGTGSKHVWETEWGIFDSPVDNNWDDGSQSDGLHWAQRIHTGLTAANLSAFFWWWAAVSNAGDNGDLISFSGSTVTVAARLWAFANYSRFIRPDAVRIGASSEDSNLQVSAYKNTNGTVSVVVLNTASNAITTSYSLQNLG